MQKRKFLFKFSYAARQGSNLNSSGIRIWWNGQIIFDLFSSIDYQIHTQTFIVQENKLMANVYAKKVTMMIFIIGNANPV